MPSSAENHSGNRCDRCAADGGTAHCHPWQRAAHSGRDFRRRVLHGAGKNAIDRDPGIPDLGRKRLPLSLLQIKAPPR